MRQSGIGWLAIFVAMAGLCMALAGARGWGEEPEKLRIRETVEPTSETQSQDLENHDAAPPDGGYEPGRLVGML